MALAQKITPPDQTILYMDSGTDNWSSLENHPGSKRRTKKIDNTSIDMFPILANAILAGYEDFATVGTIVVDEHSTIANNDLLYTVETRAAKAKDDKDPDTPSQADYNTNTNRVVKATRALFTAPCHVILVAHEKMEKQDNGVFMFAPLYTPKLGSKLREMSSLVAYMTATEAASVNGGATYQRFFRVHPTNRITAKTRVGGLSPLTTYREIAPKVSGWIEGTVPTVETQEIVEGSVDEKVATENSLIDPED